MSKMNFKDWYGTIMGLVGVALLICGVVSIVTWAQQESEPTTPSGLEQVMLDRRARAYPSDRYEILENDSIEKPIRVRELPPDEKLSDAEATYEEPTDNPDVQATADGRKERVSDAQITAARRMELVDRIKELQEDIAIDKAQLEADPVEQNSDSNSSASFDESGRGQIEGSWQVEFTHDWRDSDDGTDMRKEATVTYYFKADGVFAKSEQTKLIIVRDRFSSSPRVIDDGTDSVNGTWEWQGKRVVAIYGGNGMDPGTEEFEFDGGTLSRTRLETRTAFTEPQKLNLSPR